MVVVKYTIQVTTTEKLTSLDKYVINSRWTDEPVLPKKYVE